MLMKTATGYIKSPYNTGDCRLLEDFLSIYDAETSQYIPYGYIVHNNALYIPNIDIDRFMKPLGETEVVTVEPNKWRKMHARHTSLVPPRDQLQENIISFIMADKPFVENKDSHQIGIVAKPGTGKAQPDSTMIPTPDRGLVPLGELRVGDYVFNRHGHPTQIRAIYPQGVLDVYKVQFDDGRSAKCCEDHLWPIVYPRSTYHMRPDILTLKEIMQNYRAQTLDGTDYYRYFIPLCDEVEYGARKVPYPAYIAGILIGGAHGRTWQLKIQAWNMKPVDAIKKFFKCDHSVDPNTNTFRFHRNGIPVHAKPILEKLGIYSTYPYQRGIPTEYMLNCNQVQSELISGLIDTCRYPGINMADNSNYAFYVTDADTVASQVVYMLWGKGLKAKLSKDQNGLYTVYGTDTDKFQRDFQCITSIEPVGRESCRCIQVNDQEHLYLTENFIVTHNTFTTIYSLSRLNRKALVVTHMTNIKKQWIETFTTKFDYNGDSMMELTTAMLDRALEGKDPDKDIYFISHQTINRWMSANDPTLFNKCLQNLGIGVKVIDEYHLHWRNSIILDLFTNVDLTIYLTATFDRSDAEESKLFSRITVKVPTYGSAGRNPLGKHVIYHPIIYSSKCPFKLVRRMGTGHGMGMNKKMYAHWQHFQDPEKNANNIILKLVDMCQQDEGKILVTVASIESSEHMAQVIQSEFPDLIVGCINSSHSPKDNQRVKEHSTIIVSTIQSSGTGVDIRDLRYVINAEPFSSKITAEQFMGRLRPYYTSMGEQKDTHLFDLVDRSIIFANAYYKGRQRRLNELAKEVVPLEVHVPNATTETVRDSGS